MCKFSDFETSPEEFHKKLKVHLGNIRNYDLPAARMAEELLNEMEVIELKMRDAYFGAGTRRRVMSRLTTVQVLAVHKAVVAVLNRSSSIPNDLTPEEFQELATEIVIELDEVIS